MLNKKSFQHKKLNVNLHLSQVAVGLLIKELDLVCARASLFVWNTPRNLFKSDIVLNSVCQVYRRHNDK